LCDLFEKVGPDAPTLCSPWTTAELAAHLVIRDRRPDLSVGTWVPLLRFRTEAGISSYAGRPWPELVHLVRTGPPSWSPVRWGGLDEVVNLMEFYVHHEDVLRAEATGPQRVVPEELERALWAVLRRMGRLMFRRARAGAILVAPDHGRVTVRDETGPGSVTVTGQPSELALVAYGRGRRAQVDMTGSPQAVDALMRSNLGLA
jgi:uncharacterized protein (TIGR03085 family)